MNHHTTALRRSRGATALLAAALLAPAALGVLSSAGPAAAFPSTSPAAVSPSTAAARVIVTSLAGGAESAAAAVRAAGGRVLASLPLIGGVTADLPSGTVLDPSYRVVPDRTLTVTGRKDEDTAGTATAVRDVLGLGPSQNEGAGATVAVVDTGVADVPDLEGRVTHVDTGLGLGTGDGYGHGTFVAGLIAGSGVSSDGKYAGVAPGAQILDVKVADATGSTSLTNVLTGLQAVAAAPHVDVVNLSLSSGSLLPYQVDPLTVALEGLWRRGITVVVPTGNDGPAAGSIDSPGTDPVLLTVGGLDTNGTAAHHDDSVPDWSGRGPTPQGDLKPDLVAPGTHVVSLAVSDSAIYAANPSARVGTAYFKGSGSSFSTAVTSGAAAALLSKRRGLSPDEVKWLLKSTAYHVGSRVSAGDGGLDPSAAYGATVRANKVPSSVTAPIPGDPALWQAYIDAVLAGDATAAAKNWELLSAAAKNWAASSWSSLPAALQDWASKNWAASSWSADFPGDGWAAKNWAAMVWAAKNWASANWASKNWAASSWSAMNWAAMNWASKNWASQNWAAANWAAMNWASANWASANWAAANWAAANWASANWAAANWAAQNWS